MKVSGLPADRDPHDVPPITRVVIVLLRGRDPDGNETPSIDVSYRDLSDLPN